MLHMELSWFTHPKNIVLVTEVGESITSNVVYLEVLLALKSIDDATATSFAYENPFIKFEDLVDLNSTVKLAGKQWI